MFAISSEQLKAKAEVGEEDFDFYRCYKCGRLITRIEEIRGFYNAEEKKCSICPCGSARYSPANLKWYNWLLPRVWVLAYYRIRGMA
jgi:hypothetical protein